MTVAEKTILVRLRALTSEYRQAMRDAGGDTVKMSKVSEQALDRVGEKMQNVGKWATVGLTAPIALMAKEFINAASDLEESVSKTGQVFADNADEIVAWASTASGAMGMSQQAALEGVATYKAMFDAMSVLPDVGSDMSTTLVQLAADMASFHNQDPTEMLVAIRAGLTGEIEPLRKFGVLLSATAVEQRAFAMGLQDTTGELSEGAKAQARYAIIMEQTTAAQGDFARTSDGLANSQRTLGAAWTDLSATLGQHLLPFETDLVQAGIKLLEMFGAMPAPVQRLVIVLGALAAAAGLVLLITGSLVRNWREVSAVVQAARGHLAATSGFLAGPWGAAIGAAVVAVGLFAKAKADASRKVDELVGSLDTETGSLTDNTRALVVNRLQREGALDDAKLLGLALETVVDAALGEADALAEVNRVTHAYGRTTSDAALQATRLSNLTFDQISAANDLAGAVDGVAHSTAEALRLGRQRAEAMGAEARAAHVSADAAEESRFAALRQAAAAGVQNDKVRDLIGSVDYLQRRSPYVAITDVDITRAVARLRALSALLVALRDEGTIASGEFTHILRNAEQQAAQSVELTVSQLHKAGREGAAALADGLEDAKGGGRVKKAAEDAAEVFAGTFADIVEARVSGIVDGFESILSVLSAESGRDSAQDALAEARAEVARIEALLAPGARQKALDELLAHERALVERGIAPENHKDNTLWKQLNERYEEISNTSMADLAAAREALTEAEIDAFDAEMRLVEAGDEAHRIGKLGEQAFRDIAAAAGMSADRINDLVAAYQALAKAQGLITDLDALAQSPEVRAAIVKAGHDPGSSISLADVAAALDKLGIKWGSRVDAGDIDALLEATRKHSGGIVGAGGVRLAASERLIKARVGEEVLTRADPRHSANGAGGSTITMHNVINRPEDVDRLAFRLEYATATAGV